MIVDNSYNNMLYTIQIVREGTVSLIFFIYHNVPVLENGTIFGKRYLLAIDHIMLALFWNYVPNMK